MKEANQWLHIIKNEIDLDLCGNMTNRKHGEQRKEIKQTLVSLPHREDNRRILLERENKGEQC